MTFTGTFAGKNAIVTGGGSGIGAALCRALVAAGTDVLCTDIDGEAAAATATAARGPGRARAARKAATTAIPQEPPTSSPSSRASRLVIAKDSASETAITWSTTLGS